MEYLFIYLFILAWFLIIWELIILGSEDIKELEEQICIEFEKHKKEIENAKNDF